MLWDEQNLTTSEANMAVACFFECEEKLALLTNETSQETTEEKPGCNNHSCPFVFADHRQKGGHSSEPLPSMKKRH